jgi:ribosomal protein S18 acetylase RimI-like enzyme
VDTIKIDIVKPRDFELLERCLAEIVADSVNSGAAISFMQPYSIDDGLRFWREKVFPAIQDGTCVLLVALLNNEVVGTVQMSIGLPPNQPHRCDVAKMVVHRKARRRGVARQLMLALEARAKSLGKTLMTLDTRTGDGAELLYASVGFTKAGVIPHYAYDPDGCGLHSTTYMYKEL